jgi:hypothetical protein
MDALQQQVVMEAVLDSSQSALHLLDDLLRSPPATLLAVCTASPTTASALADALDARLDDLLQSAERLFRGACTTAQLLRLSTSTTTAANATAKVEAEAQGKQEASSEEEQPTGGGASSSVLVSRHVAATAGFVAGPCASVADLVLHHVVVARVELARRAAAVGCSGAWAWGTTATEAEAAGVEAETEEEEQQQLQSGGSSPFGCVSLPGRGAAAPVPVVCGIIPAAVARLVNTLHPVITARTSRAEFALADEAFA